MQITVVNITKPEWKNKGKAKWQEVELTYTSDKGEKSKKFLSFNDIYKSIVDIEVGVTYEVRLEKDGDFWNWVGIEKVEGAAAPKTKTTSGGTDWNAKNQLDRERFEFEKEKQILIIRQSMIAAAVARLGQNPGDVFEMADLFVDYVLTGNHPERKKSPGRPRKETPEESQDDPDIE